MKNYVTAALMVVGLSLVAPVQASQHSVSLGYAQSKVQKFTDIKGVNVKYRYEWNSPVSFISSFTYMSADKDYHESEGVIGDKSSPGAYAYDSGVKFKYYSLSFGPAYRINDYISLYGLLGANVNDVSVNEVYKDGTSSASQNASNKKTSLTYGVGVQINPLDYLVIDLGYQGSSYKDVDDRLSINGFNLGVGYRF